MAMVYPSIANGGTIYQPTIGKALISHDGTVVKTIKPKKVGTLPVLARDPELPAGLPAGVTTDGTGHGPFADFPLDQIPVAAKTGTAEVNGK